MAVPASARIFLWLLPGHIHARFVWRTVPTKFIVRRSQNWSSRNLNSLSESSLAILAIGLLAGLKHALDADHIAAVSTIVSHRKNLFSSVLIGAVWGIGHTASLLLAGVGVILLKIQIDQYEKLLEFCVGVMLIGLG